jgi:5-bromo-4-chloroindolyl phosphate hydrolysis protein
MITKDEITEFFKTQNKILVTGGSLSILLIFLGIFHSLFALAGMITFMIVLIICDVRETKFKNKFKNERPTSEELEG